MRFDCNQSIKNKCNSQRKCSTLCFIGGLLMLLLLFLLSAASGGMESFITSFSRDIDIDRDTVVVLVWLFGIVCFADTIASLIGIVKFGKLISQLEQSYLRIDGAFVSGFGASISREDGAPFSVKLSSITSVQYNGVEDGYNLILNTVAGTYKCLSIANAPQAAQAINQAIADYKNKSQQTAAPAAGDRKCLFCGAPMSNSQQFCGSCGRRQD